MVGYGKRYIYHDHGIYSCYVLYCSIKKKDKYLKGNSDNLSGNMLLLFVCNNAFYKAAAESRQFRCLLAQDWKLFAAGVQSERDQVTLNVILFLPFGILWDIIRENKSSLKECAVIGGLISLSVETMQYISARGVFDIEDLLTNIIGMIIGTVIIKVIYII